MISLFSVLGHKGGCYIYFLF